MNSATDLVRLLPTQKGTVLFVDLTALRKAGWGGLLSSAPGADDFPLADIDAAVIQWPQMGTVPMMLMRGRLDFQKLGRPGHWLLQIQPDVAAAGPGRKSPAGLGTVPKTNVAKTEPFRAPDSPLWVRMENSAFEHPETWPASLRPLAASLSNTTSATFWIAPASDTSGAACILRFEAKCSSAVAAKNDRTHLEIQTKLAALELVREHRPPNPADLTGVLTTGTFESDGDLLRGWWPVRRELLDALQR